MSNVKLTLEEKRRALKTAIDLTNELQSICSDLMASGAAPEYSIDTPALDALSTTLTNILLSNYEQQ